MANTTNSSGSFQADVEAYIADRVLPLARRRLVAFQFGDPLELPEGRGTTYTATRYNRIPLPYAALSEGVAPDGLALTFSQVSATALQWGSRINITDVAELTIKHPLFKQAQEKLALQTAETLERNTFNNFTGFTQVNYVNTKGARASLLASDVMNVHEMNRAFGALDTIGAPMFDGQEETNQKYEVDSGGSKASSNPRMHEHYAAITHPLVKQDLRENSTFVLATSYSDINRLYNNEFGEYGGIRVCTTQMCPSWTGVAQITGTAGTAGSLATGTYYVQVTASDTQNQYESRVYQVSGGIAVTGPTGSISVVLPTLAGFTFNVYVGLTTSPGNLGLSVAGPTTGVQVGQATQMAGGQTVIITGTGVAQIPPAAPATGVTVYPFYVFGKGAYGQVMLRNVEITALLKADKSDPLNQLRVIGWKVFYGTIILNQQFAMRIECASSFTSTFG